MDDYLNEDYCEFMNDASASSFGWNFQSNAGIFLFLKYIKDADSIKIESKFQDIEIKLSNGNRILAQAKSSQDYTIATNKKEKFKDAVISLAKFSADGEQLIYISNIPDTFDSAKESFNNKIVSYLSCPQGVKDEINQVFESTCNSMRDKISKETNEKKVLKTKRILKLVEQFDKSKLYISVISPFWGDDQNRYSEISNSIVTFLVYDLKLCIDEAIAIKQRLLEYWQFRFQHNSSQPDKNEMKKISKKEFAWPIAVYLTKEGVPDISECLSFTPDQSITEEVRRLMLDPLMIYHERFEFSNRVIQDYIAFRKTQSNGIKEIEMHFIKEHGNDYCDEFRTGDDTEIIEYVTKAFIYKILINHRNMAKIQAGIGVKS